MHHQTVTSRRLGRRSHLALALGLALGIGVSAAMAAQPQSIAANGKPAASYEVLTSALVSGEPTRSESSPPAAGGPAPAAGAGTASTTGTITVTNCNDSGTGSLRTAVGSASSGDIIDMSGLSCKVTLQSSIVTSVNDLTIKGKPNSKYPILDGQNADTPLVHFGSGTLTLKDMRLQQGLIVTSSPVARGGCLFSSGNLSLQNTTLVSCVAENTATGIAEGGALAALGNVTVSGGQISGGTARNSGNGDAQGGAIWSVGTTIIEDEAIVAFNTAEAQGSGNAEGGGIYSGGAFLISDTSSVSGNTATAASGTARAGGIFAAANATVKYSQINDNQAESTDGSALGGGMQVDGGLTTKYSTIAGNKALSTNSISVSGGIRAAGNVSIGHTTISGNVAQRTGGLSIKGTSATQPAKISHSTISGNMGTNSNFGAGMYAAYDTEIENSTITGNIESNPGDNKYGAGVSVKSATNVELYSTIVSGNELKQTDNSKLPSDIDGAAGSSTATLSGDYNLIGFSSISYPGSHSIQTFSPGLEVLADNGGVTETHALTSGSPAINAGVTNGEDYDQRGTGFVRVVGSSADIGAFEYGADDVIFANGFEAP